MDRNLKNEFKSFLPELVVYGILVTAYCLLVLRFLGDWLAGLFHQHRELYAAVALLLMVGQGFVLEQLTSLLLRLARWGRKEVK